MVESNETTQAQAQRFLDAAEMLGALLEDTELMARMGWRVIEQEESAADTVLNQGQEVISALRRMAMCMDRAAYVGR